jgi:hypothetical protein
MIRLTSLVASLGLVVSGAWAQAPAQPKVQPGPNEPDWVAILEGMYGLSMFGDLLNPLVTTPEATPGLFQKVGTGPVTFTPVLALGLEVPIHGGYYVPGPSPASPRKTELWSYQFKHTAKDLEGGQPASPPLRDGSSVTFDPGDAPFGLWIGNDQFRDAVYSQPQVVSATNPRLAKQPYKAMIYPNRDKATGKLIPNSYLIGWEYSTNDDFQDVVCRIDHVQLIKE